MMMAPVVSFWVATMLPSAAAISVAAPTPARTPCAIHHSPVLMCTTSEPPFKTFRNLFTSRTDSAAEKETAMTDAAEVVDIEASSSIYSASASTISTYIGKGEAASAPVDASEPLRGAGVQEKNNAQSQEQGKETTDVEAEQQEPASVGDTEGNNPERMRARVIARAAMQEAAAKAAASSEKTAAQAMGSEQALERNTRTAGADREYREKMKQEREESWGDRHPAATDWIRRDIAERTWQERERQSTRDDRGDYRPSGVKRSDVFGPAGQSGISDKMESDWRMGEFDDLINKENGWRRTVYKWWLRVWDSAGEEYLFEEEEPDYGSRWESDLSRRAAPDRASSPTSRWRSERDERFPRGSGNYADEYGRGGRREDYQGRDYRMGGYGERGYGAPSYGRTSSTRPGSFEVPRFDEQPEESLVDEDRDAAADEAYGATASTAASQSSRAAPETARGANAAAGRERRAGYTAEDPRGRESRAEQPRAASAPSQREMRARSREEYVQMRLERLLERVDSRWSQLLGREKQLGEMREVAVDQLQQLRLEAERGGDDNSLWDGLLPREAMPSIERSALRRQHASRLMDDCAQLRRQRFGVMQALDATEEQQHELQFALDVLRSDGPRALQEMVFRRELSRELCRYLDRLL